MASHAVTASGRCWSDCQTWLIVALSPETLVAMTSRTRAILALSCLALVGLIAVLFFEVEEVSLDVAELTAPAEEVSSSDLPDLDLTPKGSSGTRSTPEPSRSTIQIDIEGDEFTSGILRLVGPTDRSPNQKLPVSSRVVFVVAQPGTYTVEVPVLDGFSVRGDRRVAVALGEEYSLRLRVVAECRVPVRFTDHDGERITAIGRSDLGNLPTCVSPLFAVVTSDSPGEEWRGALLDDEGGAIAWESGSFTVGPMLWLAGDPAEEWVSGIATQAEPPPFVVSVVVGRTVIASQWVRSCSDVVEFRISENRVSEIQFSLEGQLWDVVADAPAVAPANARTAGGIAVLRDPEASTYFLAPVSKDGSFRVDHLPPGTLHLLVELPGYERRLIRFTAEAGQSKDMGKIPLRKATIVAGRITSRDGTGVQAPIWVGTLGEQGRDMGIGKLPDQAVSEDGYFVVAGLPPERLVIGLRASSRWCMQPITVDTSRGSVTDLALTLEEGVVLRIDGSSTLPRDTQVFLVNSSGLCVWKRRPGESGPWEFRVAPAKYELVQDELRIPVDARAGGASVTLD